MRGVKRPRHAYEVDSDDSFDDPEVLTQCENVLRASNYQDRHGAASTSTADGVGTTRSRLISHVGIENSQDLHSQGQRVLLQNRLDRESNLRKAAESNALAVHLAAKTEIEDVSRRKDATIMELENQLREKDHELNELSFRARIGSPAGVSRPVLPENLHRYQLTTRQPPVQSRWARTSFGKPQNHVPAAEAHKNRLRSGDLSSPMHPNQPDCRMVASSSRPPAAAVAATSCGTQTDSSYEFDPRLDMTASGNLLSTMIWSMDLVETLRDHSDSQLFCAAFNKARNTIPSGVLSRRLHWEEDGEELNSDDDDDGGENIIDRGVVKRHTADRPTTSDCNGADVQAMEVEEKETTPAAKRPLGEDSDSDVQVIS